MSDYWPWWAGALSLAVITVGYAWMVQRPFGVSGAWDRVLHYRRERDREREDAAWARDSAALVDALAAATAAQFGPSSPSSPSMTAGRSPGDATVSVLDGVIEPPAAPRRSRRRAAAAPGPVPVLFQAVLLISMFAGGLLAAVTSGRFEWRLDMGDGFSQIVTDNPLLMVVALFVGGVLVGFGTRLAGGCSSGHGLSGCSRLQPASIIATAVFFGTGVVVSFLLWKVL